MDMKRFLIFFGSLLLVTALALALIPNSSAKALPEYASQTGEPCATCHISPSGGGPRGPRGQAWVASGKPGAVPDTLQSLELLGVELSVDPAYFTVTNLQVQAPEALETTSGQSQPLYRWLNDYDGN
jgi:mono/diheme cytochrome c family protein